jgi:hypothetical protein
MTVGEARAIVRDLLVARSESEENPSYQIVPNETEWEAIAKLAGVKL